MKRVVRKSGKEIYGPKWQNMAENEDDEDALPSASVETNGFAQTTATPLTETNGRNSKDNVETTEIAQTTAAPPVVTETNVQTFKGISIRGISLSNSHDSMYKATLVGDCVAAEMLLESDPKLASDYISELGDRALHVAAAINHKEMVRILVEKLSKSDLALLDGNGYTACCYAAISAGAIDIVDLMIRTNPTLATARDTENKTPIYKAAFLGNAKIVSHFLKFAQVEDLLMEEWFDLLLVTIRSRLYGVALEILGRKEQLATMTNDEGTALHLLARQAFFMNRKQWSTGVMRRDFRLLAGKLWEGIQRMGKAKVIELMKNPPILHDAAKVGNVELITMITQSYPDLVWHTNSEGYTIFHIAVKYRKGTLFGLIEEIGARKDLIAVAQDANGNNILHLAAELGPRDLWHPVVPSFRLRQEVFWFEAVKSIVPPVCRKMRNKEGHTPEELYLKEHKSIIEKNRTWSTNTADSWMLISTLIFSVVFASAFAVPGGYNQDTGIPILSKSNWFTCFIVFEALAMFFSALSVFFFSLVMMEYYSTYRQPIRIESGLIFLSLSVFCVISVFMSAYFMIYVEERAALVMSVIIIVYIILVSRVFIGISSYGHQLPRRLLPERNRHSLFKRQAYTTGWIHQTQQLLDYLGI